VVINQLLIKNKDVIETWEITAASNTAGNGGALWTVPGFLIESKKLIPALQQLLTVGY